jgi:hypothetical protein
MGARYVLAQPSGQRMDLAPEQPNILMASFVELIAVAGILGVWVFGIRHLSISLIYRFMYFRVSKCSLTPAIFG